MARTSLIWFLCIALVFLGVSGLHGHLSEPGAAEHIHAADHADDHPYGHVVTVFDADHFQAHERHGDIDIDPLAKAFGKGPLLQMFAVLLFVCCVLWLINTPLAVSRAALPPLRPPKVRYRPHLLPPSQAPPNAG